ncbi:hypothetical protein B0H19DRAFT_1255128 [Mycena capillaripes]|nr:hypothetical protein B0H19DRAFT_1255128 [Mycena capillaripes]
MSNDLCAVSTGLNHDSLHWHIFEGILNRFEILRQELHVVEQLTYPQLFLYRTQSIAVAAAHSAASSQHAIRERTPLQHPRRHPTHLLPKFKPLTKSPPPPPVDPDVPQLTTRFKILLYDVLYFARTQGLSVLLAQAGNAVTNLSAV